MSLHVEGCMGGVCPRLNTWLFGTKKSPWLAEQSYSEPWGCYELRRAENLNALLVVGLTYTEQLCSSGGSGRSSHRDLR